MLNQTWDTDQPLTPPPPHKEDKFVRQKGECTTTHHEAVNILNTPVTESRSSVRLLKTPPRTIYNREDESLQDIPMTPNFTPKKKRTHTHGISKSSNTTPRLSTAIGAVSPNIISKNQSSKYMSPKKIRPISLGLQLVLAQEEWSSEDESPTANNRLQIPQSGSLNNASSLTTTPKGKVISDELVERWHGKSINKDSASDSEWSDYENLMLKKEILDIDSDGNLSCNRQINNPFITTPLDTGTKINIPKSPAIDYSTHAEYYNNKTGERIIRELTKEERRIKPKKLDLTVTDNEKKSHLPTRLTSDDSGNHSKNAGEKFLLNNLNSFMVDSKPKRGLNFDIFKDKQH